MFHIVQAKRTLTVYGMEVIKKCVLESNEGNQEQCAWRLRLTPHTCQRRHQMFVDMVRKSCNGAASPPAVDASTPPPPATEHNLAPSEVQDLNTPESLSQPSAKSSTNPSTADAEADVPAADLEGSGRDGFSERVVRKGEATIEFEGQVVAQLKSEGGGGEPGLTMDSLLKGRMFFPMEGLVGSIERAKLLLRGR